MMQYGRMITNGWNEIKDRDEGFISGEKVHSFSIFGVVFTRYHSIWSS